MSLKDAAAEISAYLDGKSAGGVALALASNLFRGPMISGDRSPAPAVFCLNTGGPSPSPYLGGHREALYRPTVQIMIRGPVNDLATGEALARGVYELIHMLTPAGWVSWEARDSAPAYLGPDRDGHGQWSINVECAYKLALA